MATTPSYSAATSLPLTTWPNTYAKAFPKATIESVTGEYTPEERRERIDTMGEG